MRHCIASVKREQIILINRDKLSIAVLYPGVGKRTDIPVLCVLNKVAFFPGVV